MALKNCNGNKGQRVILSVNRPYRQVVTSPFQASVFSIDYWLSNRANSPNTMTCPLRVTVYLHGLANCSGNKGDRVILSVNKPYIHVQVVTSTFQVSVFSIDYWSNIL